MNLRKKLFKIKKGFSLLELLVVIAIIGVLSAVGVTSYSGYTRDAKIKVAVAQHKQVVRFISAEMYRCMNANTFAWGGNCSDVVDEVLLRDYLNDFLGLTSPYGNGSAAYEAEPADDAAKLAHVGRMRVIMNNPGEYPVVVRSYIGPNISTAETITTSIEKSAEVFSNAPWEHIRG
ncbi:prepilin-type N-terminal cleavage/methylation domain-containing protein [Pelagibacteraceae bacterium]|jgi:prepilin-type N-terminal cleavage/methylation domain-containing protein|nr:prepilin-type N-terminal cleavage/methylation domain-containing protein [Pelagibacteraceae bacterium]